MNFCIARYLLIESSPINAIWFIKTNFLEGVLKYCRKYWCNRVFSKILPLRAIKTEKSYVGLTINPVSGCFRRLSGKFL